MYFQLVFKKLKLTDAKINLSITNVLLEAYGGTKIKPLGTVKLKYRPINKNYSGVIEFLITETDGDVGILGLDGC